MIDKFSYKFNAIIQIVKGNLIIHNNKTVLNKKQFHSYRYTKR